MLKCEPMSSILIVDDNIETVRMLRIVLEGRGYQVLVAYDGGEAIQILETSLQPPALILSDLMMPAVDGLELLTYVRRHPFFRTISFMMMSASPTSETREAVFALGGDAYLTQPIKFDMLNTAILNLGVVPA